jgi:hypothetical protein
MNTDKTPVQNIIFFNTCNFKDETIKKLRDLANTSDADRKDCIEMIEKFEKEWELVSDVIFSVADPAEMRTAIRAAVLMENEIGIRGFAIEQIKYALCDF